MKSTMSLEEKFIHIMTNLKKPHRENPIKKINLFPNAPDIFLTIDCIIENPDIAKKYKDYFIDINDFCRDIIEGKFDFGYKQMTVYKKLIETVSDIHLSFMTRLEEQEALIDEEVDAFVQNIINKLHMYRDELKEKLKQTLKLKNNPNIEYLNESKKTLEHNIDQIKQKYVKVDAKSFMVFVDKNKSDYGLIEKFVSDFLDDYREMAKQYADVPEKVQVLKKAFDKNLTLDDIMTHYIPNSVKFKAGESEMYKSKGGSEENGSYIDSLIVSAYDTLFTAFLKNKHFEDEKPVIAKHASGGSAIGPEKGAATERNIGTRTKECIPFGFVGAQFMPDIKITRLSEILLNMKKLKGKAIRTLTVDLVTEEVNQKNLIRLGDVFRDMGSIQHLNLKMNSGKIGREEIEILTNSIAKFKGLDSIEMNLMRNNLTGEEAITVSEAINNFLDVRSLVLYLEGNKIGPSGSSVIFSKFFDMTKLQLLRLNMNYCHIGSEGMRSFCNCLEEVEVMQNLTSLQMSLKSNELQDEDISRLLVKLTKLTELKNLKLNFTLNKPGAKTSGTIGPALGKLENLEELRLSFKNTQFRYENLDDLSNLLDRMKYLKVLKLNLAKGDLVPESVIKLAQSIVFISDKMDKIKVDCRYNLQSKEMVSANTKELTGILKKMPKSADRMFLV